MAPKSRLRWKLLAVSQLNVRMNLPPRTEQVVHVWNQFLSLDVDSLPIVLVGNKLFLSHLFLGAQNGGARIRSERVSLSLCCDLSLHARRTELPVLETQLSMCYDLTHTDTHAGYGIHLSSNVCSINKAELQGCRHTAQHTKHARREGGARQTVIEWGPEQGGSLLTTEGYA